MRCACVTRSVCKITAGSPYHAVAGSDPCFLCHQQGVPAEGFSGLHASGHFTFTFTFTSHRVTMQDAVTRVFLFPGQGSQAVGMFKASMHLPTVQAMLDKAAQVLGFDLKDVCLNGVCGFGGSCTPTPPTYALTVPPPPRRF